MKWLKQNFIYILILVIVIETIVLLRSGFAGIRFNEENQGLVFYSAKPYLKVSKNTNGSVTDVEVFYLPDLQNPQYLRTVDGIGTNRFDLTLENGILKSFENETDSKATETLAEVYKLLDKLPEEKPVVVQKTQEESEVTVEVYELDENNKWQYVNFTKDNP